MVNLIKISIIIAIIGSVVGGISLISIVEKSNETTQYEALVFSNMDAIDITRTSATIVSNTSVPVICEIEFAEYKQKSIFVSDVDLNSYPHTEHKIMLNDLNPDTRYNYQFHASYGDKDFLMSIKTFTTLS